MWLRTRPCEEDGSPGLSRGRGRGRGRWGVRGWREEKGIWRRRGIRLPVPDQRGGGPRHRAQEVTGNSHLVSPWV